MGEPRQHVLFGKPKSRVERDFVNANCRVRTAQIGQITIAKKARTDALHKVLEEEMRS